MNHNLIKDIQLPEGCGDPVAIVQSFDDWSRFIWIHFKQVGLNAGHEVWASEAFLVQQKNPGTRAAALAAAARKRWPDVVMYDGGYHCGRGCHRCDKDGLNIIPESEIEMYMGLPEQSQPGLDALQDLAIVGADGGGKLST